MVLHRFGALALLVFEITCYSVQAQSECLSEPQSQLNATAFGRNLWATPILEYRGLFSEDELTNLAADVQGRYAEFLKDLEDPGHPSQYWDTDRNLPVSNEALNDYFFTYQEKNPVSHSTLETVRKAFVIACEEYARENGLPPLGKLGSTHEDPVFCWAAVHSRGMSHGVHTHPGAVLAGTFYLEVPPDAGSLSLVDPRGRMPPFERDYKIAPEKGKLVLLPATLPHGVGPTFGEEPRVSISCNYAGDWELFTESMIVSDELDVRITRMKSHAEYDPVVATQPTSHDAESKWIATAHRRNLWATPILEYRGLLSKDELKSLAEDVQEKYAEFLKELENPSHPHQYWDNDLNKPVSTDELTDFFFTYQYDNPVGDDTLEMVRKAFLIACEDYVEETGLPPLEELNDKIDEDPVFCWAAVHSRGMSHTVHTHPEAVLAGTFYLDVPSDGGFLSLLDPRGSIPPFEQTNVKIAPEEGKLVLFPGTLPHGVGSTFGEKPRVSISCNHAGDWEKFTQSMVISDEHTWSREMTRVEEARPK